MTDQARVLDVRTLAPAQRHLEILRAFDALRPGDAFILVNDHDPKPLLYTFQVELPGAFDWSLLEAGPVQLRSVLGEHNVKEEELLYPAIDGIAGPEAEREALVRRLQAV